MHVDDLFIATVLLSKLLIRQVLIPARQKLELSATFEEFRCEVETKAVSYRMT